MTKKLNLLLVDDSEIILSRLKLLLNGLAGIDAITTATTLNSAREKIENDKPDVIILDAHLPDGNGILFLKGLKQRHPEIRVVMLSNLSDAFFKAAAQRYGADHFFDKSMEFEKIPLLLAQMQN